MSGGSSQAKNPVPRGQLPELWRDELRESVITPGTAGVPARFFLQIPERPGTAAAPDLFRLESGLWQLGSGHWGLATGNSRQGLSVVAGHWSERNGEAGSPPLPARLTTGKSAQP